MMTMITTNKSETTRFNTRKASLVVAQRELFPKGFPTEARVHSHINTHKHLILFSSSLELLLSKIVGKSSHKL